MKTSSTIVLLVAFFGFYLGMAAPAAGKAAACPRDSVRVGPICVDKYEASVWEVTNVALVNKIKTGTVTEAQLIAGGAIQRGVGSDDYGAAGCSDNGNDCTTIYAVSIPGVTPSRYITWFQAVAAARNSSKRLLTSAEWQAAALGTPDPGVSAAGSLDCNTKNGGGAGVDAVVDTASRFSCVSDVGVFDMVGNLDEWVADWLPASLGCYTALYGSGDYNCLVVASTTIGPGALIRGGAFTDGTHAGVFAVDGSFAPQASGHFLGFRAAR